LLLIIQFYSFKRKKWEIKSKVATAYSIAEKLHRIVIRKKTLEKKNRGNRKPQHKNNQPLHLSILILNSITRKKITANTKNTTGPIYTSIDCSIISPD